MQKIVTILWFDGRVEEAIAFYLSIFAKSRMKTIPDTEMQVLVQRVRL